MYKYNLTIHFFGFVPINILIFIDALFLFDFSCLHVLVQGLVPVGSLDRFIYFSSNFRFKLGLRHITLHYSS